MNRIADNIRRIEATLPPSTQLIVVSKYRTIQEIKDCYDAGVRIMAENRVQALLERKDDLPEDIQWHLIGHLQTNKVKYIAEFVSMIHSVDSLKLLLEINRFGMKFNRKIPVLIQLHVAQEESKFGLTISELDGFFQSLEVLKLENALQGVEICGLMSMASFTPNEQQIRAEFTAVQQAFVDIRNRYFNDSSSFNQLSIGMSGDYKIALEYGSTMVRIGTAVFE
jgi:pyridoxal phosphate enzyme (YggS family)